MKKFLSILALGLAMLSCQKENDVEPQKGSLVFSVNQNTTTNGRTQDADKPAAVLISIKDASGNYIEQNKKLPLYSFGQSYTSESLDLLTGDYTVTEFLVLNDANEVLYVCPIEGSELASLVNDALPVAFQITKNGSTMVTMQVLPVNQDNEPEDFGYASFSFEVVQPEQDINLTFIASTNPFMTTNGYDSAIVTFSSGETIIRKKLSVISPVEARGTIKPSELGILGASAKTWEAKITAYYESIDEVPYNLHINEAVATVSITIAPDTKLIKFEGSTANMSNASEVYSSQDFVWENWAHLTDETGYFHFVVKNDICDPQLKYEILKDDVYSVYYDKYIYDEGTFDDYRYGEKYNEDFSYISKGSYTDNNTFANFCPSETTGTLSGSFYFAVSADAGYHACYLVWLYKDTPIDPENPNGPKTKVGGFQIVSDAGLTGKNGVQTGGRRKSG